MFFFFYLRTIQTFCIAVMVIFVLFSLPWHKVVISTLK